MKDYFKKNWMNNFDEEVFDLLQAMDDKIEKLPFENYLLLKNMAEDFLKAKGKSAMARIVKSSVLKTKEGVLYEIDVDKRIIDYFNYGQFTGK